MSEVTFKVESGITPAQLQTKLNQWRHDHKVVVRKFVDNMVGKVSAVIELYPKDTILPVTLERDEQTTQAIQEHITFPHPTIKDTPPWDK